MPETTVLTDAISRYLESVRDTGKINMMGAVSYLERDFDLSREDARTALIEWTESFNVQ